MCQHVEYKLLLGLAALSEQAHWGFAALQPITDSSKHVSVQIPPHHGAARIHTPRLLFLARCVSRPALRFGEREVIAGHMSAGLSSRFTEGQEAGRALEVREERPKCGSALKTISSLKYGSLTEQQHYARTRAHAHARTHTHTPVTS